MKKTAIMIAQRNGCKAAYSGKTRTLYLDGSNKNRMKAFREIERQLSPSFEIEFSN